MAQWLACWAHNSKVGGSKPLSANFPPCVCRGASTHGVQRKEKVAQDSRWLLLTPQKTYCRLMSSGQSREDIPDFRFFISSWMNEACQTEWGCKTSPTLSQPRASARKPRSSWFPSACAGFLKFTKFFEGFLEPLKKFCEKMCPTWRQISFHTDQNRY